MRSRMTRANGNGTRLASANRRSERPSRIARPMRSTAGARLEPAGQALERRPAGARPSARRRRRPGRTRRPSSARADPAATGTASSRASAPSRAASGRRWRARRRGESAIPAHERPAISHHPCLRRPRARPVDCTGRAARPPRHRAIRQHGHLRSSRPSELHADARSRSLDPPALRRVALRLLRARRRPAHERRRLEHCHHARPVDGGRVRAARRRISGKALPPTARRRRSTKARASPAAPARRIRRAAMWMRAAA